MEAVQFTLPPEVMESIAERAAAIVRAAVGQSSPWLTRPEAAEYLRVPVSRLEKAKDVPCIRWEGRILYNRDELDAWLQAQGRLAE